MLAICSDLDGTPDRHVYWEIMRFLNTTATTAMGPGLGLDVGNTIYFDMPPDQFSYWNTDDAGREMVRALIRSGHIDCLHSYGDLATTRAHAGRALDELNRHGCRLEAWVDHAVAPTNFGPDIMRGHGDEPGHPAYHADLTCGFGVRYVWRGRVTSMIGQDVPPSLGGIFTARHPAASARTLAKEAAKHMLACCGGEKYAMHGPNRVMREVRLRDGRPACEFLRCDPYWGGVGDGATPQRLSAVLTRAFLDRLVAREGVCILYTHLGKVGGRGEILAPAACEALRLLAQYHHDGRILVTTTRRLLGYCRAVREVVLRVDDDGRLMSAAIDWPAGSGDQDGGPRPGDLDGLTWYLAPDRQVRASWRGRQLDDVTINPPDHTGRASASLAWRRLAFPESHW